MEDSLVEKIRLEKMDIGCECGVDVNQRPRNYTRTTIRRILGLQIFGYFCKNCKQTFGFYAKGIIPDCPPMFSRHSHEGGADTTHPHSKIIEMEAKLHKRVSEYKEKLEKEGLVVEPMGRGRYLDIVKWGPWNEDWGDKESYSGGAIPIFSGHETMEYVLSVIDPDCSTDASLFLMNRGCEDIHPFREYRNGKFVFSGSE